MKINIKIGLFLLFALLQNVSCVKKELESDSETESSSEMFLATAISNDMVSISDEAARSFSVGSFKSQDQYFLLSGCATLKFDTLVPGNIDTITVDFGSTNCTGQDGRSRRGKLEITFTGKYRDSLTKITVIPINYFVNDNEVSGTKSIRNLGHNASKHLMYDIKDNLTITRAENKGVMTFVATRIREWFVGEKTSTWSDDQYYIIGNASGMSSNGREYRSNVTKNLIRNMAPGCRRYFTAGEIEFTPLTKATRYINFGNGTCDNIATVKVNGKEYEINLP